MEVTNKLIELDLWIFSFHIFYIFKILVFKIFPIVIINVMCRPSLLTIPCWIQILEPFPSPSRMSLFRMHKIWSSQIKLSYYYCITNSCSSMPTTIILETNSPSSPIISPIIIDWLTSTLSIKSSTSLSLRPKVYVKTYILVAQDLKLPCTMIICIFSIIISYVMYW